MITCLIVLCKQTIINANVDNVPLFSKTVQYSRQYQITCPLYIMYIMAAQSKNNQSWISFIIRQMERCLCLIYYCLKIRNCESNVKKKNPVIRLHIPKTVLIMHKNLYQQIMVLKIFCQNSLSIYDLVVFDYKGCSLHCCSI